MRSPFATPLALSLTLAAACGSSHSASNAGDSGTSGIDGSGDDSGERVSHFWILRHQRFYDGNVVLIGLVGIGNVGGLIFHDQVQVVAHNLGKHSGKFIGSRQSGEVRSFSVGGKIRGPHAL